MNKKLYVGNLPYSVTDVELRELFAQYGQVNASKGHCAEQRPQIRCRSALGVMTAKSGSHPQNGQIGCDAVSGVRWRSTSAHFARNGRSASTST